MRVISSFLLSPLSFSPFSFSPLLLLSSSPRSDWITLAGPWRMVRFTSPHHTTPHHTSSRRFDPRVTFSGCCCQSFGGCAMEHERVGGVGSGSAWRCRERRLLSWPTHEQGQKTDRARGQRPGVLDVPVPEMVENMGLREQDGRFPSLVVPRGPSTKRLSSRPSCST